MKCGVCDSALFRSSWIITQMYDDGGYSTVNICQGCMWSAIGRKGVQGLNAALFSSHFSEGRVPEPS